MPYTLLLSNARRLRSRVGGRRAVDGPAERALSECPTIWTGLDAHMADGCFLNSNREGISALCQSQSWTGLRNYLGRHSRFYEPSPAMSRNPC